RRLTSRCRSRARRRHAGHRLCGRKPCDGRACGPALGRRRGPRDPNDARSATLRRRAESARMIRQEGSMVRTVTLAIALALTISAAQAQSQRRSGMRFWNLTLYTLTSLQFSPPGQNAWAKNQCENDDDKTVDHDE